MTTPRYAELRCRSCFSFLEGASQPEELVARAQELGLSALALTDVNGLYGIVKAHAEAKRRGLALVVGAELFVAGLVTGRKTPLVLLAMDREGYANLCRLATSAHGVLPPTLPPSLSRGQGRGRDERGQGPEAGPRREKADVAVPLELLADRSQGLFALYPGADGDAAARLKTTFGARLALAVARHRIAGEEAKVLAAQAVGRRLDVRVAVVNDVFSHDRRRQPLQDVLTCIRHGTTVDKAGRRLFPNAERTLKGPDEMARLWSDFPEGLVAAAEIAETCTFRMSEIHGEHPLPPIVVDPSSLAGGAAVSTSSPGQADRAIGAVPASRLRCSGGVPRLRPRCAGPTLGMTGPRPDPQSGIGAPPPDLLRSASQGLSTAAPGPGPLPETVVDAAEGPTRGEAPEYAALGGMALLRELVREGARWRYRGEPPEDVARQLAKELSLVEQLGYASYFLTVWDIVRFARSQGILCQGRGSAANSAICYVLGVTSIDPVRMGLLFERFLSAERGEPPDIDVDFEHERREEVIQYVYARYGRDRAGMVCEVISYRGKSALRDVGKALGLSLGQVDRLAKLVGAYEDLSAMGPELLAHAGLDGADSERVRLTLSLAGEIQGFPRHLSIHVGGFVITRRPLHETVPIEPAAMPGRTIVQWDKDDIAELGLLKVDLLGLGMLTALSRALAMLAACRPAPALETPVPHPDSLATIPAEDPAVYEMLTKADSIGVFQVESRAQMGLAPRMKPRCFYDLVISVAIIRPGPIQGGMVHPYLRRRDGLEQVHYPYPPLEPVLARTLGVPLFQEQAMRLAVVAAGFTPGEADELRRVMTHRRSHEKLAALKSRIVDGMAQKGIPAGDAEQIHHQLLGFAGYGFPESHAASFALLVYASAWLRRYHPAVFTCALVNSQPMGFYAPHTLVEDAKRHGVEVRPVDVTASAWESSIEGRVAGRTPEPGESPAIRVGLHAIRGLPRAVGETIVAARRESPFEGLGDLARRAGLSKAWLVRLAEAGALGALAPDRRSALWRALALPGAATPGGPGRAGRVGDTADLFAGVAPVEPDPELPAATAAEEVSADFATTGLSVKGHPMAMMRGALGGGRVRTARELSRLPDRSPVEVAGLVIVRQRPETAHGIVFVSLEDETGIANLVVMPDVYEKFRPVVRQAPFLVARGQVERNGLVVNVKVDSVSPLALAPGVGERARNFH